MQTMENLKRRFQEQDTLVGNWLSAGHSAYAELTGKLEFDFALIDIEHTPTSLETLQHMVHAIESTGGPTAPLVRMPENDRALIKRVLDLGVPGVMVPMIETAEEAEELVESVRYPPKGKRGIAGSRAAGYGLDFVDYVESANERILTVAQIENQRGLDNVEEIAAVDGIDAVFVGPADLSGALGVFAEWDAPELSDAMEKVVAAAEAADIPAGTLTVRNEDIQLRVDQGFDFLIVGKDTYYFANGSREAKSTFEDAVAEREEER